MRLIEENQIVNDGENLESVLSKWTIDFYNKFKELFLYYENEPNFEEEEYNSERINEKIIRPRFVEMRPKIFQ